MEGGGKRGAVRFHIRVKPSTQGEKVVRNTGRFIQPPEKGNVAEFVSMSRAVHWVVEGF